MEKYWLSRQGGERLVVFVLGWAADHRIVEHIDIPGADILCIYDYRAGLEGHTDLSGIISPYRERVLFAWSFGVWAAEQLFGTGGISFKKAVAFNGTPFPVHESYGIQPRRMFVTIRGLAGGGMEAFSRRAYGSFYEGMSHLLCPRPLEDNIAELTLLSELSTVTSNPMIPWDKAIVGEQDGIFPPENMIRYWGNRAQVLPLPHYPFGDAGLIASEIDR